MCLSGFTLMPRLEGTNAPVTQMAPSFLDIWIHNVVTLAPLWLGALSFGALTVIWLAFQGFAHGLAVGHAGLPLLLTLGMLWKHGIVEVASIILAATFGILPGVALFTENRIAWSNRGWAAWIFVWIGLLGFAAWLEVGGV